MQETRICLLLEDQQMGSSETSTRMSPPIQEIDVLWITAGLGCDGDTIAMTAATQPSIEDVVGGALPWIPRVRLLNPFLSFENGDDGSRLARPSHLRRLSQRVF
jgi:hypothetical protein